MKDLKRGIVKIKPVYLGIYHYRDLSTSGSVCLDGVIGTPQIPTPTSEELSSATSGMINRFKESLEVDFLEIEEPLIVKEIEDLRKLPKELSYDIDALLVGTTGAVPLALRTLSQYKLPIIRGTTSVEFLRALRVKKFLKESRFIYIGEIPSFSVPGGPYEFPALEERLGVGARHIETNEFYRWFDRLKEEEVKEELENWRNHFDEVIGPGEEELMDATRIYLALLGLCKREDANGVVINCGRFTEERAHVPCLAFDRLIDEGIMCACEGDITAMLSSLILHAVSGQPVLMGNFGYTPGAFAAREGEVVISHGLIPLSMAKTGFTIRDYHGREFGVTGYAEIKTEPMTLLNLDTSLNRICVIEGKIKGSEDGFIHYRDGGPGPFCRILIRMSVDGDVSRIPSIIVGSQHISMTFGHWLSALREVGGILGFEVRHL